MFPSLNRMFVGDVDMASSQEPEFLEEEDEEWVLVDFIDTCPAFSAEDEDDEGAEPPPDGPAVFPCLAEPGDSCFLQLEESWFVTPPPCFTAAGGSALKVETSPLENLLIEHPSMSVYAVHSACPARGPDECPGSPRGDAPRDVGPRCFLAALTAHTAFLEPPKSLSPSQWIREASERQSLNRNSLRRQNLTRECQPRHARHSSWALHQPCPRQFNY